MSLDELQQITKVQKRYLMAIEENDFDSMPGTFYVRAFIRQYAHAVGLNGAELVNIFDGKVVPEEIEAAIQFEELGESRSRQYEDEDRASWLVRSLPAIVFSLIGLAIAVTVFYVTWLDGQSNPIIKPPAAGISVEKPVESSSTPNSESQAATIDSSSATETSSSEGTANIKFDSEAGNIVNMTVMEAKSPIKLEFTGKNATGWIGVSVDGAYTYQYTLNPGEKQETELPAEATNATITLGASGNTDVLLNGQKLDFNPNNSLSSRKDIVLAISYKQ